MHVLDRGPGMTAEQRARACESFWRNPAAQHAGEGGGRGPTIAAQLARASGGDFTLHPAAAGGLDATVPSLRRGSIRTRDEPAAPPPYRLARVLVPHQATLGR